MRIHPESIGRASGENSLRLPAHQERENPCKGSPSGCIRLSTHLLKFAPRFLPIPNSTAPTK